MIWESRGFRDLALALGMTVCDEDLKVIEYKNGLESSLTKTLLKKLVILVFLMEARMTAL